MNDTIVKTGIRPDGERDTAALFKIQNDPTRQNLTKYFTILKKDIDGQVRTSQSFVL